MNPWTIDVMRRIHAEASEGIVVENGLVRYDRPGHTRQVAHLPYCHEGRYSAGYYALGMLLERRGEAGKPLAGTAVRLAEEEGGRSRSSAAAARMAEDRGIETLRALAGLQIADPASEHYGAFRWYAEEEHVQDSNAAFFILMPLVSLRLRAPEAVPPEHAAILDGMLRLAAAWFERECREPELYYPNKTMSDGAMLLAIAHLLGDGERTKVAADYFERWESYTARRGWGWGENMSLVYQSVMLNALEIAEPLLRGTRPELAERLNGHRERLLDILRFHDGRELVPSIRSYNFGGEVLRPSLAWLIAGVAGTEELADSVFHVNDFPTLLLFEGAFRERGSRVRKNDPAARTPEQEAAGPAPDRTKIEGRPPGMPEPPESATRSRADGSAAPGEEEAGRSPEVGPPVPRIRQERVFDDATAYSWIGRRTRLGSLNRFPVIPGSYQHETWGLGWQSFPLSAVAEEGQVSHARWYVDDGETVRTHPAESYKTAYLMPALFRESPYPDARTYAVQSGHALLALRVLENIRHAAAEIADEWVIPGYAGEADEIPGGDGRFWHVLRYPGAAIAITPLGGIRFGGDRAEGGTKTANAGNDGQGGRASEDEQGSGGGAAGRADPMPERRPGILRAERDGERLKLRQVLYAGGPRMLRAERLDTGWAVLCLDEAADEAAVRARLARVAIQDDATDDREMPREPHERVRRVRLLEEGYEPLVLELDPHAPR